MRVFIRVLSMSQFLFLNMCVMKQGFRACSYNHLCADRCVQLFWHSGQLPPISLHKENIDIKWLYCATPQKRKGLAISFPQRITQVNCLTLCMSVVIDKHGEEENGKACKTALRGKQAPSKTWIMLKNEMGWRQNFTTGITKHSAFRFPWWVSASLLVFTFFCFSRYISKHELNKPCIH